MNKIKTALLRFTIGASGLLALLPSKAFGAPVQFGDFIPGNLSGVAGGDLPSLVRMIIQIILIIALVVAVIFLIISGYNYITAGGDAEKATVARTGIINAIIGLIVIFASYLIISFVYAKLLI